MLMQLQREFETLKKSNEEELSMLRAENTYMRWKLNEEIVLNTSFETVQPRTQIHQRVHNEESFEATRRRLLEASAKRHPFSEAIRDTIT